MAATVADQSAAVAEMAECWPMIDALVGGTGAMRKAGKLFLPQFPKETDDSYKIRLSTTTLFPAFSRTTSVLAAKPLSKPILVEHVPEKIEELFENVDGQGSTLHAFASQLLLTAGLQYGIGGVLVDVPPRPEEVKTLADEEAAGIRPYLAIYKPKSILGWRVANGALTQLRLLETVTEEDGEFGENIVTQVRVLVPGSWQVWRCVKGDNGKDEWVVHESGTTSLSKIPFVFFYGLRECLGVGRPPLLDLAYLNVEHWQSSSDQQTILHTARVPILFGAGFPEDADVTIGAANITLATNEHAKLEYVEHTGAAIGAGRQSLLDLEDRMRQTGAELLVQRPMQTTATQTVSEGEGSKSILQRIVEVFEESLEACVDLMGEWMGLKFESEITLFKDFGAVDLSDQSSNTLITAQGKGIVSKETAFKGLQRRDIVPADVDWHEEQERIAQDAKSAPEDDDAESEVEEPAEERTEDQVTTDED